MQFVSNYWTFSWSLTVVMTISFLFVYSVLKKSILSIWVVLGKFSFFVIYFSFWCYYRPVVLTDDQTYFRESLIIFDKGTTFSFFISRDGLGFLGSLAGGWHFGYYIYNVIAFHLFGSSYYAPVLMNMLFSVLTATLFYKTLIIAKVEKKFAQFAFLFFLLHWDIMSWSSFINLKDTFVLFLTVCALYNIIKLKKGIKIWNIVYLLVILFIFQFIRFYFAYFLVVTGIIFIILNKIYKIKYRWMGFWVKVCLFFIMPIGFYFTFIHLFARQLASLGEKSDVIAGMIRYLLTPVPFHIDPEYSFITVASCLHWLFLPVTFYGLYIFVKRYFKDLMPFLILTLLLIVFYGSFSELQGPRHRIPMICFFALVQSLGSWEIIKELVRLSKSGKTAVKEL